MELWLQIKLYLQFHFVIRRVIVFGWDLMALTSVLKFWMASAKFLGGKMRGSPWISDPTKCRGGGLNRGQHHDNRIQIIFCVVAITIVKVGCGHDHGLRGECDVARDARSVSQRASRRQRQDSRGAEGAWDKHGDGPDQVAVTCIYHQQLETSVGGDLAMILIF